MFKDCLRYLALAFVVAAQAVAATAEEGETVPARTVLAREALAQADWEVLEEGLSVTRVMTASGLALTALRISTGRFRFGLAVQARAQGERVEAYGERAEAVVAVNGGFFGEKEDGGVLFPVGLLRVEGRDRSAAWTSSGGFLSMSRDGVKIAPSQAGMPEDAADILQSKPLLIEPGGHWAMNSNQGHLRKRSIVCLTPEGDVVLVLVTRLGLSLYEAGWLMRGRGEGGFFGCDAALALDGGGSTQLWVAGRGDLSHRGETPVHNALVVRRR